MNALLETRGVSKAFGEFRALEDVSIAVASDELVSVIGPNGAGKTTLVNLLTVEETIATALISRQGKRWHLFSRLAADAMIRSRAREVARIFGLDRRLDAAAAALSQGEKKLLDVASAFALDPEVILLDEPTSGVSTGDKHEIMEILIAAGRKAGVKAIVLVEHDMDLVAAYSSRIVALSGGKVLADLPPDRFFADAALVDAVVGRRRAH